MNENVKKIYKLRIERTIKALESNNMSGIYAETREDALRETEKLLSKGCTVSMGGCASADEAGITELLKSGKYHFLNRNIQGITPEEIEKIYRDTYSADAYITSSNAITESGELYNVDGNSNRVSAMLYGPKKVIVIAGRNKLVHDLNDAVKRVKSTAAPANSTRLGCDTYCSKTGMCVSLSKPGSSMCDGCESSDRICCNYTVMSRQRKPGRIFVIIVNDELGF